MRGNHSVGTGDKLAGASIPACAGEPKNHLRPSGQRIVYPRVCGGTPRRREVSGAFTGLSPRVRGNRGLLLCDGHGQGSIPACAGEPPRSHICLYRDRVYPRVCGGTSYSEARLNEAVGLSPRVRGNPPQGCVSLTRHRSIPACAGEPTSVRKAPGLLWVYPRVCGGTIWKGVTGDNARGSIPACAGEPLPFSHNAPGQTVYPRVCGGTPLRGVMVWVS